MRTAFTHAIIPAQTAATKSGKSTGGPKMNVKSYTNALLAGFVALPMAAAPTCSSIIPTSTPRGFAR